MLKPDPGLDELLHDACRFVVEFYEPISVGALHIYSSALLLIPRDTVLFRTFRHASELESSVTVLVGREKTWNSRPESHLGDVKPVAAQNAANDVLDRTVQLRNLVACVHNAKRGRTYVKATPAVTSVSLSPNGTRMASVTRDGIMRLWDSTTGMCIATHESQSSSIIGGITKLDGLISSVIFSPDGSRIVSESDGGDMSLWDPITGDHVAILEGCSRLIVFSPDSTRIISESRSNEVLLWNSTTGTHIAQLKSCSQSVKFSSDSRRIIFESHYGELLIWDSNTGSSIAKFKSGIWPVKISPDGVHIIAVSFSEEVSLWNSTTGLCTTILGPSCMVNYSRVEFSPSSSRLVSGIFGNELTLWDLTTGASICKLEGSRWPANFSPDSARIITQSIHNELLVWDAMTGAQIAQLENGGMPVKFSPDSTLVVSGSKSQGMLLWRMNTCRLIATINIHSHAVEFSHDGMRIVSWPDNKTVQVWSSSTGALIATLNCASGVQKYIFSDQWVVGFDSDQFKRICSLPLSWRGHRHVEASDQNRFILGSDTGRLTILDLSNVQWP